MGRQTPHTISRTNWKARSLHPELEKRRERWSRNQRGHLQRKGVGWTHGKGRTAGLHGMDPHRSLPPSHSVRAGCCAGAHLSMATTAPLHFAHGWSHPAHYPVTWRKGRSFVRPLAAPLCNQDGSLESTQCVESTLEIHGRGRLAVCRGTSRTWIACCCSMECMS